MRGLVALLLLLGVSAASGSSWLSDLGSGLKKTLKQHAKAAVQEHAEDEKHKLEEEMRKLVQEGMTKAVDAMLPNTVPLHQPVDVRKTKGPADVEVNFTSPVLTNLKATAVDMGNLTMEWEKEHGSVANLTISVPQVTASTTALGKVCVFGSCKPFPPHVANITFYDVKISAAATFDFHVLPLPHLTHMPCIGPVSAIDHGKASVSGNFGSLEQYVDEAVNAALEHDALMRKAAIDALNLALKTAEAGDDACVWAHES